MRLPLLASCLFILGTGLTAQAPDTSVYQTGNGIGFPALLKSVKPEYTQPALTDRLTGRVFLDAVVLADGTVGDVAVVKDCLGYTPAPQQSAGTFPCVTPADKPEPGRVDASEGLNQSAVDAAKQWMFKPATNGGIPVAVRVTIELVFQIPKDPSTERTR